MERLLGIQEALNCLDHRFDMCNGELRVLGKQPQT